MDFKGNFVNNYRVGVLFVFNHRTLQCQVQGEGFLVLNTFLFEIWVNHVQKIPNKSLDPPFLKNSGFPPAVSLCSFYTFYIVIFFNIGNAADL